MGRTLKRMLAILLVMAMLLPNFTTIVSAEEDSTAVTEAATEPTTETTEATEETTEPPTETTEATEETTEPPTETTEATEETTEPTEETSEPTTEPTEESTEPTEEATEPAEETLTPFMYRYSTSNEELGYTDEEAFAAYVERTLYGIDSSVFGTAAGEALAGHENKELKILYDALVPIIKQIASGQRSSTSISVGAELDGFVPDVVRDLGASEYAAGDLRLLFDSLLADLPYELYWHDKEAGIITTGMASTTSKYLEFHFVVSSSYGDGSTVEFSFSDGTVEEYCCSANRNLTSLSTNAVTNAQAVVNAVAADPAVKTDYDVLCAYKDWILKAVSYDEAAAKEDYSGGLDPWQLLYVFDNNASTNVVCEGYSKAFQYLCDLTEFQGDVTVTSVYGWMGLVNQASGAHMWNLVELEGGRYMADLTNSDTGSIGQNGGLFLVGTTPDEAGIYLFDAGNTTAYYIYNERVTNLWGTAVELSANNYVPESTAEETIAIDEVNFPDSTFRYYVEINFDSDGDGYLSKTEYIYVSEIYLVNWGISDLKGIEYFTNLKVLYCGNNPLTELDVSKNTKLLTLDCYGAGLTALNVGSNTALEVLICGYNNLKSLNLAGATALKTLSCGSNPLGTLDVSANTALEVLYCDADRLSVLDVSNNPALRALSCEGNYLTGLTLNNHPALLNLNCVNSQLTSLDISGAVNLEVLTCGDNELGTLNTSNNPALESLSCFGNRLTVLDMEENTALRRLFCTRNPLRELNVRNCTALVYLDCYQTELTALDVSNHTALEELNCGYSKLESLNLTGASALRILSCGSNPLKTLDVSTNTALEGLYCDATRLTALDVSNNPALRVLTCDGNYLTELALNNHPALQELSCFNNHLASLDLRNAENLKILTCGDNALTALNVSENACLESLSCFGNQLTSVNLHADAPAAYFYCENNSYEITAASNRTFDLSTLPGAFDAGKASNWTGGTVDGNILTVAEGRTQVSYTYDCGNARTAVFTLKVTVDASEGTPEREDLFTYTVSGTEATITGYLGQASNLVIPSTLGGNKVVAIGADAFNGNIYIDRVVVPEGVSQIEENAFYGSHLTSISLPKSLRTIGASAFRENDFLLEAVIPEGVAQIGASAFADCENFSSISLPSTLKIIDDYAFRYSKLDELTLPEGIQELGAGILEGVTGVTRFVVPVSLTEDLGSAQGVLKNSYVEELIFKDGSINVAYSFARQCSTLSSVTLPNTITTIGQDAFAECFGLKSIQLPDSLRVIEPNAFASSGLTSLTLPANITRVSNRILKNVSGVKELTIPKNLANNGDTGYSILEDSCVEKLIIEDGATNVPANVANSADLLKTVIIPNTVTSIEDGAFEDCTSLTAIDIPDSVTEIGGDAFFGCKSLKTINLPTSLISIGAGAFARSGLTSLTLPANLEYVGFDFLTDAAGVTELTIPKTLANNQDLFQGILEGSNVKKLTFEEGSTQVPKEFAAGCTALKQVILPSTLTTISNEAFKNCTSLETINFPNGLVEIQSFVFAGCSSLKSVELPDSLQSIGSYVFEEAGLTSLTLPGNITYLGSEILSGVEGVTELTIPKTLGNNRGEYLEILRHSFVQNVVFEEGTTHIPAYFASECSTLTSVTMPDTVTVIDSSAFSGCTALDVIDIPASLSTIGSYAFSGCSGLQAVDLPDGLQIIGSNAFADTALTSLEIPATVTQIDAYFLSGTEGVTELIIPKSLANNTEQNKALLSGSSVQKLVFENGATRVPINFALGCTTLTDVILPDTITEIWHYAFKGCTALPSIKLPKSVTYIGVSAFENTALTEIVIPNQVKEIFSNAFANCGSLTSITIPASVKTIADSAFTNPAQTTIYGEVGSYAETFAQTNGMAFVENTVKNVVAKYENEATDEKPVDIDLTADSTTVEERSEVVAEAIEVLKTSNNTHISVTVSAGDGDVTISVAAAKKIAEKVGGTEPIRLAIDDVTNDASAIAGAAATYEITMKQGEKDLFTEGESQSTVRVSISLPAPEAVTEGTEFAVCYVADNGTKTKMEDAKLVYGKIIFSTTHFSTYTVEVESTADLLGQPMTNVIMGNSLSMMFAFEKDSLDQSKIENDGYYVEINRSRPTGYSGETVKIQSSAWGTATIGGKEHITVTYKNVAAKEMADSVTVQMFQADGTAVSVLWRESIRAYAMRRLDAVTEDYEKRLFVDALNYGAAAQKEFEYNEADLANNQLSEEQKTYGSEDISLENKQVTDAKYYASNLQLKESLTMLIAYQGIDASKVNEMYAKISYVDHYGRQKEVEVPGEEFGYVNIGKYSVIIDEVVAADIKQEITCEVYNADGSLYSTVKDSISSYLARRESAMPELAQAVMKYCTSAHTYLHINDN